MRHEGPFKSIQNFIVFMGYYDLHVEIKDVEKAVEMAVRLGYSGVGIVGLTKEETKNMENVISVGLIKAKSKEELKKKLSEERKKYEVIIVSGGIYDVNRAACEDSRVDILAHPEYGRNDSGLDHVCVKAAAENNVAIEINFSEILNSTNRVRLFRHLRKNIMLARKYGAEIVIASGAKSLWEMRAPRDLAGFVFLLGLDLNKSIDGISTIPEEIVNVNREKLEGKRFGDVRVVDNG